MDDFHAIVKPKMPVKWALSLFVVHAEFPGVVVVSGVNVIVPDVSTWMVPDTAAVPAAAFWTRITLTCAVCGRYATGTTFAYVHVVPDPPVVTAAGTVGHDIVVIGPALMNSTVDNTAVWYGCVVEVAGSARVDNTIVFETASGPLGSIVPPGGDVNTRILLTVDMVQQGF